MDDEIRSCQQVRKICKAGCSDRVGSIQEAHWTAILLHVIASMARLTAGSIRVPFCLVHAPQLTRHASWVGDEKDREKGGPFEPLDKLLGAGRLGVRYLIGSLEHSSVSCRRATPVGVAAELIEKIGVE